MQRVAVHLHPDAQARERQVDHAQILGPDVDDREVRAGDRAQADERGDLDVVRPDAEAAAAQPVHAVHDQPVGPDALDPRAQGHQEPRQVLYVGLAGGVPHHRLPRSRDRGHQGVLGRRDRGLVQEDLGSAQAGVAQPVAAVDDAGGAEPAKGQQVGVHAPPADEVARRRAAAPPPRIAPAAVRPAAGMPAGGGRGPGRAGWCAPGSHAARARSGPRRARSRRGRRGARA